MTRVFLDNERIDKLEQKARAAAGQSLITLNPEDLLALIAGYRLSLEPPSYDLSQVAMMQEIGLTTDALAAAVIAKMDAALSARAPA